jgi:hypothetical protein
MSNDPNSVRKVGDADVQRVVRDFIYPNQEASLRREVESWGVADFLYAMDRVDTDVHQSPLRFGSHQLFRQLLDERKTADSRVAAEAANERRHQELVRQLEKQRGKDTTTLGLLRLIAMADGGFSTTLSKEEFAGFKRLEVSGYIFGQIGPSTHDDEETMVENVSLTASGEIALEKLEERGHRSLTLALAETATPAAVNPKAVFVVHGHDKTNLDRLATLLRKRFKLEPIILREKPGKGQTIIEKFESEATAAAFAFVLITPDDLIQKTDIQYRQPRRM